MKTDILKKLSLEQLLFFTLVILHLLPVFETTFFLTYDGPAHLYNSNIIRHLPFDSFLDQFIRFNHEPVPNWLGHALLTFFNAFTPAYIAEKIVLCLYLIALPYAFRRLLQVIAPKQPVYAYFIFPFIYSMVFLMGFYNFCFALVLLFLVINHWLRHENQLINRSFRSWLTLGLLLLLLYFSHLFVFGISVLIVGFIILWNTLIYAPSEIGSTRWKYFISRFWAILIPALLPLGLSLWYFFSRPSSQSSVHTSVSELTMQLYEMHAIIGLNPGVETEYTTNIFLLLMLVACFRLYFRIRSFFHAMGTGLRNMVQPSDSWLLLTLGMLLIYYLFPNHSDYGGIISQRLGLLFFILLLIWITTEKLPFWLTLTCAAFMISFSLNLNKYYGDSSKPASEAALACHAAADYIEPNSVVLPIWLDSQWYMRHYSNYLGIDKPMVILENYECSVTYFPLIWNWEKMPCNTLGGLRWRDLPCSNLRQNDSPLERPVDYVFALGKVRNYDNPCEEQMWMIIDNDYQLIYSNRYCSLFKRIDRDE